MKRKLNSPGPQVYYDALKRIFELESGILTATLPHAGERGRNDEERFRSFLTKVLPRRFSIGTGFLVCSNPSVPPSRQMDTVIYDEIHNSPLHRELAAYVFPIEMVYATVEVKGLLTPSDLVPVLESIARIRRLAKEKYYIVYGETAMGQEKPDQMIVQQIEVVHKLAPRAFLFAYDATWKRHGSFVKALEKALASVPEAHIHGAVVLAKEWFAYQVAYAENKPQIKHYTDNGLLRLTFPPKTRPLARKFDCAEMGPIGGAHDTETAHGGTDHRSAQGCPSGYWDSGALPQARHFGCHVL